jgi:hypothetical protein
MTDEVKTFNLVGAMTVICFVAFLGTASYAFATQLIDWKDYSAAVGPIAGALVGYWLKGTKSA